MGRHVDLNSPLSAEDKEYLRLRGREYLIPANERRFGSDGTQLEDGDVAGQPQQNPLYDTEVRNRAVYDQGGAPLPGTVLDHDTGRVADRENGILVEYTGPGYTNSATDLRLESQFFDSHGEDEDIDQDIVDEVVAIKTVKELKTRLTQENVEIPADAKRQDLEDLLAIALQDKRDAGSSAPVENLDAPVEETVGKHEAPADFPTAGSE